MSVPGLIVEIIQAARLERIDYRYCARRHLLALHEHDVRCSGCPDIDGRLTSAVRDCSRKLLFVPAGHRYHDWHVPLSLSRLVFFYLNPAQLARITDLDAANSSPAPRLFCEDTALMHTALKFSTALNRGGREPRPYLEALRVVLAHELVYSAEAHVNPVSTAGGLAAWQRHKAIAYIEEHRGEPISLAELAGLVGLSASYFCRAFRQSFGIPPQRYHLRQRMEHAKQLLAGHTVSVTEVGHSIGYNDTSAFCTAFRRVTGQTPRAYRRNVAAHN
jgi:AraC family transcriptional regulator